MADLAARARELDRLSRRIVPLLPAPLRDHVSHASLRNDRVLLLVESPAWATRTRMDQTRILAAVHSLGLAATSVAAKIMPIRAPDVGSATVRPPSPETARRIRAAATAISDPELRDLFLELAAVADDSAAQ